MAKGRLFPAIAVARTLLLAVVVTAWLAPAPALAACEVSGSDYLAASGSDDVTWYHGDTGRLARDRLSANRAALTRRLSRGFAQVRGCVVFGADDATPIGANALYADILSLVTVGCNDWPPCCRECDVAAIFAAVFHSRAPPSRRL